MIFSSNSQPTKRDEIIGLYLKIKDDKHVNHVRFIARTMGYSIDKNGSNDFVRRVIKSLLV